MAVYLGDFLYGQTVRFCWNSNDSNGASVTRATNGTISVYREGSLTQFTTGVTDTEDFDGLTGVHHVAIDTSTSASSYAPQGNFSVVLSAATIDGQTVNAVLAEFSVENRGTGTVVLRTTIATLASQTSFTLTAGAPSGYGGAYTRCSAWIRDADNPLGQCMGYVSNYSASTKTITLAADPAIFTMAAGDFVTLTVDEGLRPATVGRTLGVSSGGGATLDWGSVLNPTTTVGLTNTTVGILTTYTGNTVQTGDAYARLGAPAGASHAADTAAVKTDTAAVKVQTDKLTFTVTNQVDSNVLDWKSATAPAMTGDAFARLGAPSGASVSADVLAVKNYVDDIGVAGAGLTALGDTRLANLSGDAYAALTAILADSVPADGTRPTALQALYMIIQFLTERSVASTTLTVKKVDGSSSLMTFTLDSGTAPTSITRAT